MKKKLWLIPVVVIAAAVVIGLLIPYLGRPTNHAQPRQTVTAAQATGKDPKAEMEKQLKRFVQDMSSEYTHTDEAAVRGELLRTLLVYEELPDLDRRLILGLTPETITNQHLVKFQCVCNFLESYTRPEDVKAFAFTSQSTKPILVDYVGGEASTPERVMKARKKIWQVADAFHKLRKSAMELPYFVENNQLHFLEMLHELASEDYANAKLLAEPVLPLLNDREGRLLILLEKWLNTQPAHRALPREQFRLLYRGEKIEAWSSEFSSTKYHKEIKSRIQGEKAKASKSLKTNQDRLAPAYSAIETFFSTLAEVSAP
jgi:hypothetical protein